MVLSDSQIIEFVSPYTCISKERLINLLESVNYVIKNQIEGDFIEIGVFKGGAIMAMALKLKQLGAQRKIHAYDTFLGMTQPSEHDIEIGGRSAVNILNSVLCKSEFEPTKRNIDLAEYEDIEYHIGNIMKTDISQIPKKIAILRLDTDFYDSTLFELQNFYQYIVPGGILIIDDFGHWKGCRKAVEEYFEIVPSYHWIDYTGIFWIKDSEPQYGFFTYLYNFETLKDCSDEYGLRLKENFHIYEEIQNTIGRIWGCGSYFHGGWDKNYEINFYEKQKILFNEGKKAKSCLEVGVFDGSSALILLISNPDLKITGIDICENDYPEKAVSILNNHFKNRYTLIKGPSLEALAKVNGLFDLIHIDADHDFKSAVGDLELSVRLSHSETTLFMDDTDNFGVINAIEAQKEKLVHLNSTNNQHSCGLYRWEPNYFSFYSNLKLPTIVTALYEFKEISRIKSLLSLDYPKIIFTTSEIQSIIKDLSKKTFFVTEDLSQSQYFSYLDRLPEDSAFNIIFKSNKFYWLEKAISLNPFESSRFIWIDIDLEASEPQFIHHWFKLIPEKIRFLFYPYSQTSVDLRLLSGDGTNLHQLTSSYLRNFESLLEERKAFIPESIVDRIRGELSSLFDPYYGTPKDIITNYGFFHSSFPEIKNYVSQALDNRYYTLAQHIVRYLDARGLYSSYFIQNLISTHIILDYYVNNRQLEDKVLKLLKENHSNIPQIIESNKNNLRFYTNFQIDE